MSWVIGFSTITGAAVGWIVGWICGRAIEEDRWIKINSEIDRRNVR